jgi:hypothetical protein
MNDGRNGDGSKLDARATSPSVDTIVDAAGKVPAPQCRGTPFIFEQSLSFHSHSVREEPGAEFRLRDETGCLPVYRVECPSVDLVVVRNSEGLSSTVRQSAAKLDMASALREVVKSEFAENSEHLASG